MGKTISFVKGKGSLNHNNRTFVADNVDPERISLNRVFVQEDLRSAYDNAFGEALKAYNAKQKRKDRLKGDYITEIKNSGNGENVFYENVVQVGTMEDTPVLGADGIPTIDGSIAADILSRYAETFQERNPNLYLFNAVLHMDEATPHLHLDYIPVAHGYKTGMETRNSLTKALQQMGFEKATGKNRNETMAWQERERAYLAKLCNERGIEVEIKGEDKRKNLTVSEYKEAMQEVAIIKEQAVELLAEKELLLTHNVRLGEKNTALENRHDELSAKIIALDEKADKKKKNWEILEKKAAKIEEKHKKISDMDEAFERNIHVYDESDKWQLPESELLQTAKSYRDKSAKPLVDALKKVVKDLTLRVIKLVEEVKEAKQLANRKSEDYKNLNDRFHTVINERDYYKGRSDDLGIVEKSMGVNRIQSIIRESKEAQEREKIIAKMEKRHKIAL